MKFKFENLIPNNKVRAIIKTYENEGYTLKFPYYTTESEDWKSINLSMTVIFQKGNIEGSLQLPKEWFKEKKPLEVGIWYDPEEFDGNPKGYGLIERTEDGDLEMYIGSNAKSLLSYSTKFMYFELPKES